MDIVLNQRSGHIKVAGSLKVKFFCVKFETFLKIFATTTTA